MTLPKAILSLAVVLAAICPFPVQAQELLVQPTPFSVWLDFTSSSATSKMALPIWMESLQIVATPTTADKPKKTTFRLRLRRLGQLNAEVQLRLFFFDQPEAAPQVTAWTETGEEAYRSPLLGEGLNLPNSVSLIVPVAGVDYLDIDVPGDGRNVQGAFVATVQKHEARHVLDFEPEATFTDPFANPSKPAPGESDRYLFGRVRATLDETTVSLDPTAHPESQFEFELASVPLMAIIHFEVLNADPVNGLELTLNQRPMGRANLILPDLADPGYHGSVHPLEVDMRFHYAGWIPAQMVVPGSALLSGVNSLKIALPRASARLAIRRLELELKYPTKNLNYQLIP